MGRQITITGAMRKRNDQIFAHELEQGDIFCLSIRDWRAGKSCEVISTEFTNTLSDWKGKMTYVKRFYDTKKAKDLQKTMELKDAMKKVIFLRKG